MTLAQLDAKPLAALHGLARELGVADYTGLRKRDLIYVLLEAHAAAEAGEDAEPDDVPTAPPRRPTRFPGAARAPRPARPISPHWPAYMQAFDPREVQLEGLIRKTGVLEILPDGYGFLRAADYSYLPSPDDIYVSPSQIKRFSLRLGDTVDGQVRPPKEGERFFALIRVHAINGRTPESLADRTGFDHLTPAYPETLIRLETAPDVLATRVVDLVAPIGKGQRGLIIAPPESGRTTLLLQIAAAIALNDPEATLIVLLVDERPEEVTDFVRRLGDLAEDAAPEVIASTFDASPARQAHIADLVLEKAKRLVEAGQDVILLVDSITRLARAHTAAAEERRAASAEMPRTGGTTSGPKRLFGAARALEEGGSLTVIGTALSGTGRDADEEIVDEFKGSGNMELVLSAELAAQRVFPAIDLTRSRTRREEILVPPERLARTRALREELGRLAPAEAMRTLTERLGGTESNAAFLDAFRA